MYSSKVERTVMLNWKELHSSLGSYKWGPTVKGSFSTVVHVCRIPAGGGKTRYKVATCEPDCCHISSGLAGGSTQDTLYSRATHLRHHRHSFHASHPRHLPSASQYSPFHKTSWSMSALGTLSVLLWLTLSSQLGGEKKKKSGAFFKAAGKWRKG